MCMGRERALAHSTASTYFLVRYRPTIAHQRTVHPVLPPHMDSRITALGRTVLLALKALLAMFLLATPATAQVISGTVTDSASRQPIPGAVVQLLGAQGEERGRGLSDIRGAFLIRATGDVRTLRVVRIGFRPSIRSVATVPATGLHVDVALARIPAFLDPVRVIAAQCNNRRNRGRSPVGLIEQVRAGLLASVVTREQNPAAMTRLTYERMYEDGPEEPTRQSVLLDSATQQTQSFRAARGAAEYVESGFYLAGYNQGYFDAPDAETLLDDAFASGYCFRVMPRDRSRPREVGLGFEPASRRAGRVDVDGALWIDTVSRELVRMEFQYIGLERPIAAMQPGGSITFRTLPNGLVIVERWQLRLIGTRVDTVESARARSMRPMLRYFEVHSGGELASATWRDGTQWSAPLGTVSGEARWRTGEPAADVTVLLTGSPFQATTDSAGRFTLRGLLPGTYKVAVLDEPLRSLRLSVPIAARVVSARDSTAVAFTLPTRADVVVESCRAAGPFEPTSRTYVLGRALRSDGSAIERAMWSVRTQTAEGWIDLESYRRTGSDGLMPLCSGLRRGIEIEMIVLSPEGLVDVQRRRLTDDATIIPFIFPLPSTP